MPRFTPEQMDEEVKRLGYENYSANGEPVERPYGQAENFTDSLHKSIYGSGVQEATPIPTQKDVGQYGQGMPIQDATPIPEQGNMKSYGPGAAFYPDGSQDYTDPARYYNNDPRFSKRDGTVIVAPSLVDPNLGVSDRDPRDYSSPGDPTGANADRRAMTRDYLSQKYGQAANSDNYDAAVTAQDRTNSLANVGHGLDQIFTARGAAYGGKGADAGFWQGMKRDAAGRTQEAGDARKQKIADYLMKQKMGSEGVAEIDQIRNSDQQAAMLDPNSGVSKATRVGFMRLFPEESKDFPELDQMNARDIQNLMKNYETKIKADSDRNFRTAQQAQITSTNDMKKEMLPYLQDESTSRLERNYALKDRKEKDDSGKRTPVTDLEIDGKPVLRDDIGNLYDYMGNKVDGSKVKSRREVDDEEARDVNGIGKARTKQEAVEMRKNLETTANILSGIEEIEKIMDKGPILPFSPAAADIRSRTDFIMGQLRLPMQGPGAMTDSDREQLRGAIGDAAGVFTIKENTKAKLGAVKSTLKSNLENAKKATIIGYQSKEGSPEQGANELSADDKQALDWANSHPNDPQAAMIKKHLGR